MNDFLTIVKMLASTDTKFIIAPVEGEHPCLNIPSKYPENYSSGVCFSFNDDGSLGGVWSYEPTDAND